MFYYVILALTVVAFVLCHLLLRSRVGYFWQAIREDEVAARSLGINTFRYKMIAIAISSGMTAPAGVFYAFYYNNLFPEQTFFILRSIEIILGPIIGGIGTLFGPVIGAFLITGLAEILEEFLTTLRPGYSRREARVLRRVPAGGGDGPAARHLAAARAPAAPRQAHRSAGGVTWQRFSKSRACPRTSAGFALLPMSASPCPKGSIFAVIGPNGAGKTTLFNLIAGVFAPNAGTIAFQGERIDGHTPDEVCRRGIGRTFQIVRPFPALVRRGQRHGRRAVAPCRSAARRCAAPMRCCGGSICSTSGCKRRAR